MSKESNFKPYLIGVLIVSVLACIFSYKISIGILIGTAYFFISDKLNQYKFPKINSKGIAVGKVFLIIFIQFLLITIVAVSSYYIGGLYTFFGTFAGITIPHIYFIIIELKKMKK